MNTFLYQDTEFPGQWAGDFGGVSVLIDSNHRTFTTWISYADAVDEDYAALRAILSRYGIAGCHRAYWDDRACTIAVLVSHF